MTRRLSTPSLLWALAALLACGSAFAVMRVANLGLMQAGTTCDGPKGTYTYTARWQSGGASPSFVVATGNQCAYNGTICGISTHTCVVACSATGQCAVQLRACQASKGGRWVRVVATNGSVYQQINAVPPGRCQ